MRLWRSRATGLFKSGASAVPTSWRWSTLPCRRPAGRGAGPRARLGRGVHRFVIRRHLYPQTMRRRPPFVLGYDVVGEIDQLGDGVSGFQLGDRVADMTVLGSNAAYRTLRADDLTRVPAGVDAAEAATLILSWTTAYQLLHRAARVQRGQRVLVHGAAGAVGQALLALGRMAGLELWGAARGEHAALVRELGATPIDYQREDFTRVLPGGFDVVFDGIGEDGYRRSFAALKRRRSALRLWLLGGRAGAATHAHHADVDRAPVSLEVVAWRQACPSSTRSTRCDCNILHGSWRT